MRFDTIRKAAEAWVNSFNEIPESVANKLLQINSSDLYEITPPANRNRVTLVSGEHAWESGEIVATYNDGEMHYIVELDDGLELVVAADEIEVDRDSFFPMWSTLWAFGENIDNEWLNGEYLGSHLQEMANCGFRIYESEDYGYIFGIDGAGYDFYDEHWIPLYKARGLRWHREEVAA